MYSFNLCLRPQSKMCQLGSDFLNEFVIGFLVGQFVLVMNRIVP